MHLMRIKEWILGDYAKRFRELEGEIQILETEIKALAKGYRITIKNLLNI